MFILLRIYYYRPTGLEIFISNNKSYYFNFKKEFILDGKHQLMKLFDHNFVRFTQEDNKVLGWYNPSYFRVLCPLFNENIFKWNEKNFYYSNFDKLMIVNLFSNRSFNDLNQYPVFPMLYDEIKMKRKMDKPIGFQDLTKESKERKKLIVDYFSNENENIKFFLQLICSSRNFLLFNLYISSFILIGILGFWGNFSFNI